MVYTEAAQERLIDHRASSSTVSFYSVSPGGYLPPVHEHHKLVETKMFDLVVIVVPRSREIAVLEHREKKMFGYGPLHMVVNLYGIRTRHESEFIELDFGHVSGVYLVKVIVVSELHGRRCFLVSPMQHGVQKFEDGFYVGLCKHDVKSLLDLMNLI